MEFAELIKVSRLPNVMFHPAFASPIQGLFKKNTYLKIERPVAQS